MYSKKYINIKTNLHWVSHIGPLINTIETILSDTVIFHFMFTDSQYSRHLSVTLCIRP